MHPNPCSHVRSSSALPHSGYQLCHLPGKVVNLALQIIDLSAQEPNLIPLGFAGDGVWRRRRQSITRDGLITPNHGRLNTAANWLYRNAKTLLCHLLCWSPWECGRCGRFTLVRKTESNRADSNDIVIFQRSWRHDLHHRVATLQKRTVPAIEVLEHVACTRSSNARMRTTNLLVMRQTDIARWQPADRAHVAKLEIMFTIGRSKL